MALPTLISKPIAARELGYSDSTYDNQRKAGLAPAGIAISPRRVAYPTVEVLAVAEARIAGKTDDEIRELVRAMEAKRGAHPRALNPNDNPRVVEGRARFFEDVRAGRRPAPRARRATEGGAS
jgi:prophage regulatory protein